MLDKIKNLLNRDVVHRFHVGCPVIITFRFIDASHKGVTIETVESHDAYVTAQLVSNQDTAQYTIKTVDKQLIISAVEERNVDFRIDDSLKNAINNSSCI